MSCFTIGDVSGSSRNTEVVKLKEGVIPGRDEEGFKRRLIVWPSDLT